MDGDWKLEVPSSLEENEAFWQAKLARQRELDEGLNSGKYRPEDFMPYTDEGLAKARETILDWLT